MNFETFDLNLLRVLDAVLSEQSVSRAAQRLHLSQPAVSHSLRKLRVALGDPLIERVGRSMKLTAEGARLARDVHELLRQVQLSIAPPDFTPATTDRRFSLAVPDVLGTKIGRVLLAGLREEAPRCQLEMQRLHSVRTPAQLVEGRLDAAISIAGSLQAQLRSSPLITLDWLPVMSRSAPGGAKRSMTLDEFVAARHAVVTRSRVNELVDASLQTRGLRRSIGLVADSDLLIPSMITGTDYVAMMPAPDPADPAFSVIELPVTLATTTFHLWWSRSSEGHPAHDWFVSRVIESIDVLRATGTGA